MSKAETTKKMKSKRGWHLLSLFIARYHPDYVYVHKANVTKHKHRLITENDDLFYRVAKPVIQAGRTLLQYDRLYHLWQGVNNTYYLEQAVAEVGSFRGGSAYFLADAFKMLLGREVPFYVFDTFEGHPDKVNRNIEPLHKPGMFNNTSYEEVKEYLTPFSLLKIYKGEFSQSVKELPETNFALVHIDVDIYQTTLDCLEYFGKRLVLGGLIVIDDYGAKKCPGVVRAVQEYLENNNGFLVWNLQTEQLILSKK